MYTTLTAKIHTTKMKCIISEKFMKFIRSGTKWNLTCNNISHKYTINFNTEANALRKLFDCHVVYQHLRLGSRPFSYFLGMAAVKLLWSDYVTINNCYTYVTQINYSLFNKINYINKIFFI